MSYYFFAVSILFITISAIFIYIKKPFKFFGTKEGRGALVGIVGVVVLALVISFISSKVSALEYLSDGQLFVGLDQTRKISPMCETGTNSDKLTSNVGIKAALITTDDQRASISIKYTHHSCAVNADAHSYDAAGVEANYKLW